MNLYLIWFMRKLHIHTFMTFLSTCFSTCFFSLKLLSFFAFLYPSLDGGFELLWESMLSCLCSSFMVPCKFEMVAVCFSFCSITPENMVIIILIMADNESTSADKSAGALSFSSLKSAQHFLLTR